MNLLITLSRLITITIGLAVSMPVFSQYFNENWTPEERREYQELQRKILDDLANPKCKSTSRYYDCVLERMPGVMNDSVASGITRQCKLEYPCVETEKPPNLKKLQIFSDVTPNDCFISKAKKTTSQHAIRQIRFACNALY